MQIVFGILMIYILLRIHRCCFFSPPSSLPLFPFFSPLSFFPSQVRLPWLSGFRRNEVRGRQFHGRPSKNDSPLFFLPFPLFLFSFRTFSPPVAIRPGIVMEKILIGFLMMIAAGRFSFFLFSPSFLISFPLVPVVFGNWDYTDDCIE